METATLVIALVAVFFPAIAEANSMAPILPVVSILGWVGMPVIVAVEGAYYFRRRVPEPFKLSLISNIVSGLVGIPIALATAPLAFGPLVESNDSLVEIARIAITFGCVIHWWLSSRIEHYYAVRRAAWAGSLTARTVFEANAISYLLIFAMLITKFWVA